MKFMKICLINNLYKPFNRGGAEKIVELGNGKLYIIKDVENVDSVVLEDYYNAIWLDS